MSGAANPTKNAPYPATGVAWYATIALAFLYWLSILDRFIISLLVDPIKKDLGLTDIQFGLLHGMAFAITYSLFGLLAGAMADRFSRRWIIFLSVSIWSAATAACGAAAHYWQLLLARVGVGAGEAGLNPSATSMLTDLFPRDRLTTAMAVYSIGATIGSGTAYLFGGMIVEAVSQAPTYVLPLIGEVRSWQAVFFIIGIPGILVSLVVFTFKEPVRRDRKVSVEKQGFWEGIVGTYKNLLVFIKKHPRFFMHHYAGFALASIVMSGCAVWYPAHMGRSFGWSASQIGLYLGLTLIFTSIGGKLICGYAADRLYRKGYRDAQFRWYGWSLLLAAPFGVISMQLGNPYLFLVFVGVYLVMLAPLPACYITALNLVTPNELRGAGVAFFSGTAGLVGMATGPLLIAFLSDSVFGGNAIGMGMAVVIGVCCPLAAVILLTGCKHMHAAVLSLEAETE